MAEAVARLAATAERIADPASVRSAAKGLDEAQQGAVAQVLRHGVSLLTGGPGTGKSRTVAAIVKLLRPRAATVALAAPTGRAAKRLEELDRPPGDRRVHRLLGAQGMTGGFARNEEWPLDADVIVVDEASMLDVELTAALLEACPDGTHLLLVGDPAQLPSIGPGHVLGDLIDSGAVPVTELTTLYRQAEGGAIARLATAVRGGELPPVDSPDREVVVVPATGSAEAARRVVQLVTDSIPRALGIEPGSVQVVTPVHRGPGRHHRAQQGAQGACSTRADGTVCGFDAGDRVVATANHLELEPTGFANGEVGVVTEARDGSLDVAFASGPATVTGQALSDLRHGWAITVHRAQGSEWPAVVVVAAAGGRRDAVAAAGLHRADPRRSGTCRSCTPVGAGAGPGGARGRRPAAPDPAARAAPGPPGRSVRLRRLTSRRRGSRIARMSSMTADPESDSYEYEPVRIPPGTDRGTAAVQLALQAEYGGWELDRVRLHSDGTRQVKLRRRRIPARVPLPRPIL